MRQLTKSMIAAAAAAVVLGGCANGPQVKAGCSEVNVPMAAVGGVVGGLLGGHVGAGVGRHAAIAVGAGTGAVLGSRVC